MPKYRFFIGDNADADEWVAASFDDEGDQMVVFHDVTEQNGKRVDIGVSRLTRVAAVQTISE